MLASSDFGILLATAFVQAHHESSLRAPQASSHLSSQNPSTLIAEDATALFQEAKKRRLCQVVGWGLLGGSVLAWQMGRKLL
jgi:hypothetical protein